MRGSNQQRHVRMVARQVVNRRISLLLQSKRPRRFGQYSSRDRYTYPALSPTTSSPSLPRTYPAVSGPSAHRIAALDDHTSCRFGMFSILYWVGVRWYADRKARAKCLGFLNPEAMATSITRRPGLLSKPFARSMRACITNWWGDFPVECRKALHR